MPHPLLHCADASQVPGDPAARKRTDAAAAEVWNDLLRYQPAAAVEAGRTVLQEPMGGVVVHVAEPRQQLPPAS